MIQVSRILQRLRNILQNWGDKYSRPPDSEKHLDLQDIHLCKVSTDKMMIDALKELIIEDI